MATTLKKEKPFKAVVTASPVVPVRKDRIQETREKLAHGCYDTKAALDIALDALIDDAMDDHLHTIQFART